MKAFGGIVGMGEEQKDRAGLLMGLATQNTRILFRLICWLRSLKHRWKQKRI